MACPCYRDYNFTVFLVFATQCYKASTIACYREGLDPLGVYCKQPRRAFVKYLRQAVFKSRDFLVT
jgi:hypothetical protein